MVRCILSFGTGRITHLDIDMDGPILNNSATAPDELVERSGEDHARVYDPVTEQLLLELMCEIKQIRKQLEFITGEELGDSIK